MRRMWTRRGGGGVVCFLAVVLVVVVVVVVRVGVGVGLIPHHPDSERLRWGRVRQRRICQAARTSTDGLVVLLRIKTPKLRWFDFVA